MTNNDFAQNNDAQRIWFVKPNSIVRTIWGSSDTILFIFAGAAAEFALNKSVDWLFFTGKLPADPLGRMFSTVDYARQIVFAPHEKACNAISYIVQIHEHVELGRGAKIPMEAYLDVLYMLIAYSIAAYECLERKLTFKEKEEVYAVFYEVGVRMNLIDLPIDYKQWETARDQHLRLRLVKSDFTEILLMQYKKHLGAVRYNILEMVQTHLLPQKVNGQLGAKQSKIFPFVLITYKMFKRMGIAKPFQIMLLPKLYRKQVFQLNVN